MLVEGARCFFPGAGDLGRQTEACCPRAADGFPDHGAGAAARGRLPHESRVAWRPPGFWPHVVWGLRACGQQFPHGGPGLLPTDNSGTCPTSPRASRGTDGSVTRAGLSSQLSPPPGPAARPCFCIHTFPSHFLSSRRLRPGQAWETTAVLPTGGRRRTGPGAVPGGPVTSCLVPAPPFPS